MRIPAAGILLVLLPCCSIDLSIPDGTQITCREDDDCPTDQRCRRSTGQCAQDLNDPPTVSVDPVQRAIDTVTLTARVADAESSPVTLSVVLVEDGARTPLALSANDLASGPLPVAYTLSWDAATHFGGTGYRADLVLELTPGDGRTSGVTFTTAPFPFGNDAPRLAAQTLIGPLRGDVPVEVTITDGQGDLADVELRFRVEDGPWRAMAVSGNTERLVTSADGETHFLIWHSQASLTAEPAAAGGVGLANVAGIEIQARVADHPVGETVFAGDWVSIGAGLDVANNEPPVASIINVPPAAGASVPVVWSAFDDEGDPVTALIEFSVDDGGHWRPATRGHGSDGTYEMPAATDLLPLPHTFVWDARVDVGEAASARLRVSPSDEWSAGFPAVSAVTTVQTYWAKISETPEPAQICDMLADGHFVYVLYDINILRRIYRFDTTTGAWLWVTDVPSGLGVRRMGRLDDRLLFGFNRCCGGMKGVWSYDLVGDEWAEVAAHPHPETQGTADFLTYRGRPLLVTPIEPQAAPWHLLDLWDEGSGQWMPIATPPERVNGYGIHQDVLYAASDTLLYAYSETTDTWQTETSIPPERGPYLRPMSAESGLYLMGGTSGLQVDLYRPGLGWAALSPLGSSGVAVEVNGGLLVGSAAASAVPVDIYRYARGVDIADSHRLPRPHSDGYATFIGPGLYLVGGRVASGNSSNELWGRQSDGTWTARAAMSTDRGNFAAAEVGGRLYVVGGFHLTSDSLSFVGPTAEVYSPATNAWAPLPDLPVPAGNGFAEGVAFSLQGKLFVTGGRFEFGGAASSTLFVYDPALGSWTTRAPMSIGRWRPAATVYDGKAYVFGGYADGALLSSAEVYDPVADTWTALPDMPANDMELGAAVLGERILLIGGQNAVGRVTLYDPRRAAWRSLGRTSFGTVYPSLAAEPGRMWLLGGRRYQTVDETIRYIDEGSLLQLRSAELEPLGNGVAALEDAAAAASATALFVAGGRDPSGTAADTLWRHRRLDGELTGQDWTPSLPYRGGAWERLATLPEAVESAGLLLHQGLDVAELHLIGGLRQGSPSAAVSIYSLNDGQWRSGTPLPGPRAAFALVARADDALVIGGRAGSTPTAEVWRYDPAAGSWTAFDALPAARAELGCAVWRSAIFCAGGRDAAGDARPEAWVYDDDATGGGAQWREIAPLPAPLTRPAVAGAGGLLVAGGDGALEPEDAVWSYLDTDDRWSREGELRDARGGAAVATWSAERTFIVGGSADGVVLSTHEELGLH